MLKSTYTLPPPLPPGWTEHKAPSGKLDIQISYFVSVNLTDQRRPFVLLQCNNKAIYLQTPYRNSRFYRPPDRSGPT